MREIAAVGLVVLLAGCFSEILPDPIGTGTEFLCAVMERDQADSIILQSWVSPGVTLERGLAISTLQAELTAMTGRAASQVRENERAGPDQPKGGWTEETVRAWSIQQPFIAPNLVALRILWVPMWGDGNQTGSSPAAGTIVLSQSGIRLGAAAMGADEEFVARAVLLHMTGHALGAVNRGTPIQDPAIQEREGPPGHDPNPTSVMHVGWEDARTMNWAANATYDRYSDSSRRDWDGVIQPGGLCL